MENKKMSWKVVNKVRHKLKCRMKDDYGDVKSSEEEVRQIWKKYFERLLNVKNKF